MNRLVIGYMKLQARIFLGTPLHHVISSVQVEEISSLFSKIFFLLKCSRRFQGNGDK
jgi:hypothetical protein